MTAGDKIKEQLITELVELRKRIAEPEKSKVQSNQTEEVLREAEVRYRGIFENAVVGVSQIIPDGHFLAINPALARMLGYGSPTELMAEVTDARQFFVDPNRRQEFIRLIQADGIVTGFKNQVEKLANMITEISAARLLTCYAAHLKDQGKITMFTGTGGM